jgi:hypothetical protein
MPRTESKTYEVQIVAGIFSTREIDDKRKEGFPNLDIPRQNIQMVVKLDSKQAKEAFTGAVVEAIRARVRRTTLPILLSLSTHLTPPRSERSRSWGEDPIGSRFSED